jgi:AraC-like DNA-binding protein
MLLFLSILGIFLSGILLYFNARKNLATLYLGSFFLLLSIYVFYQYILVYSKSVLLVSIFLFNIALVVSPLYLIGPMLYWYFRSVLTDHYRLSKKDLWHLLPMLIYFVSAIPYSFVPWEVKVETAQNVVASVGSLGIYRVTLLASWLSPKVEFLSRPVLTFGYTLWSAGLVINYLVKKKGSGVLSKQHFMKKWLFLLLGFLLILEITQIVLIIKIFEMHFSELFFTINIIRILSLSGLIGLLISPFFFPAILYGLPRYPEFIARQADPGKKASHFESEYIHYIRQKADSCMKEHQPYLQPDFNLAHLSVHTQIPVHHLSYFFREEKKQHFNEYRNQWRINHAKKLIKEGKANEFTLETIGLQSGFTSRNAFLTTFKKVEGITPSTFAARLKNKGSVPSYKSVH